MGRKIDYHDDVGAPKPNGVLPAVCVVVTRDDGAVLLIRRTDNEFTFEPGLAADVTYGEVPRSLPGAPPLPLRRRAGSSFVEVIIMACPPNDDAEDATRWWRAYLLAQNDQADQLRALAASGDDHARRQLASWLADRAECRRTASDQAMMEEAAAVIRPLTDAGDDVADRWLASWLANGDHLDELRRRAEHGSDHCGRELERRLAELDMLDELRRRAGSGSYHALHQLARRLSERDRHDELRELVAAADPDTRELILDAAGEGVTGLHGLRVLADLGHRSSRAGLARSLARKGHWDELRQRAEDGDEYAQGSLTQYPR